MSTLTIIEISVIVVIIAWNAFKEDRQITRLQGPKGKLTTANFPEPK